MPAGLHMLLLLSCNLLSSKPQATFFCKHLQQTLLATPTDNTLLNLILMVTNVVTACKFRKTSCKVLLTQPTDNTARNTKGNVASLSYWPQ